MGEAGAVDGSVPDDSVDGLDGREQASLLRATRLLRRSFLSIGMRPVEAANGDRLNSAGRGPWCFLGRLALQVPPKGRVSGKQLVLP